jgi:hypothetical protein
MKPKKPRLNHDPAELFGKEARKGLQPLLRRLFSAMVVIGESSTGQSEELRKAGELQARYDQKARELFEPHLQLGGEPKMYTVTGHPRVRVRIQSSMPEANSGCFSTFIHNPNSQARPVNLSTDMKYSFSETTDSPGMYVPGRTKFIQGGASYSLGDYPSADQVAILETALFVLDNLEEIPNQ